MTENLQYKYSFEPEHRPQNFSTNDLDIDIRAPSVKDASLSNNNSRAYAGAMKTLQDKIKILEQELQESREYISVVESKHLSDREKWQTRLLEEIQMGKERENLLQLKHYDIEEDLKKLLGKLSVSEEQLRIKEIQCKFSENEAKRLSEQYSIELENANMQLDYLSKSFSAKTGSEKKLQKNLENAVREKELAEEELKQQRRINSSLQSEVNYLRENSDFQRESLRKSHESLENELAQQTLDFTQKIKELEIKNKSLRELSSNQSQQILHLKKEVTELSKINEVGTVKVQSVKGKSFTKKPPNRLSATTRKSASPTTRKSLESEKLEKKKMETENSYRKTASKNSDVEEGFKKQISLCEKEIDKLSNSYRDLVYMSSQGSGNLSVLRKDMAKLASDIEKKNEELFEYKKRQQEFLRERLLN